MAPNPVRGLRRLMRLLTRGRVSSSRRGEGGFGPPGAGVREPRRPDPTLPGMAEALPDPQDPART